jgi:hypothetical protein
MLLVQGVLSGQPTGVIIDSSGRGIAGATVVLKMPDNIQSKIIVADTNGRFAFQNLPIGNYSIAISAVGFFTKTLLVHHSDTCVLVQLEAKNSSLEDVVVTGHKKHFELTDEKVIYHYGRDTALQSLPVIEGLRNMPFLTIDPVGNILYKDGKENICVLVDGKRSIVTQNPTQVLRSYPPKAISKIELILNPSSTYKVLGYSAVLNIITYKGLLNGFIFSTSNNVNTRFGYGNSNFLLVKSNKINISVNTNYIADFNKTRNLTERISRPDHILRLSNTGNGDKADKTAIGNLEVGYEFDSLRSIGAYINLRRVQGARNNVQHAVLKTSATEEIIQTILASNNTNNTKIEAGFTYQHFFKRSLQEFSVSGHHAYLPVRTGIRNTHLSPFVFTDSSLNKGATKETAFQVDFIHPVSKSLRIENTANGVFRQLQSSFQNFTNRTGAWAELPDLSGSNRLNQNIVGITNNINKSFKTFRLIIGNTIQFASEKILSDSTNVSNRFWEVIPNITYSRKMAQNSTFSVKYSFKIRRPGLYFLNGFLNQTDPFNITIGNPKLKAEHFHSLEVGYNTFYKKTFVSLLFYNTIGTRSIQRFTRFDSLLNTSTTQFFNNGTSIFSIIYTSAGVQLLKNWRLNATLGLGFQQLAAEGINRPNNSLYYTISGHSIFNLPKNFSLQANCFFNAPTLLPQGWMTGTNLLSMGINKMLPKNKGSISLSLKDPFLSDRSIQTRIREQFVNQRSVSTFRARMLSISCFYQLGNLKSRPINQHKKILIDDQKAAN